MVEVKADLILTTDNSITVLHGGDSIAEPAIVVHYFVLEPVYNVFFSRSSL